MPKRALASANKKGRALRASHANLQSIYEGTLVDLVGIEPTTSSTPWSRKGSGRFVFKWLATGILAGNEYISRYFRPISGQNF